MLKMLHTVNTSAVLIPGRAITEFPYKLRATSYKPQASSDKPQASSIKLQALEFLVNRFKRQAASFKPQATSDKLQAARAFIKFFILVNVRRN
jgi:hypothetical protein